MPFAVLVILYVLATAGVVGLAIFVSYLADLLQKKTKYSAALISGVLLGIMTGIPELVTGLTSVIGLHSSELAVGDVLGSNVFNIFTLGLFTLIFFKNFKKSQIQKSEFINIGSLILVYALYVAGFFTNGIVLLNGVFSIISLFVMVIYVINV
jgi:cation:H+ antiporter